LRKRFQLKKRFRQFGLAFLVFSSVLLTLGAIHLWSYFGQPFAGAAETFGVEGSWDGQQPLNLLWVEVSETKIANLSVISLNPTSGRFSVFNLPLEYEVELPSQDRQSLQAVYQAGDSAEPRRGVALAAKSASYLLGVSVDGYLVVSASGLQQLAHYLGDGPLKSYFSVKSIVRLPQILVLARDHLQTSLSLGELARVVYFLWQVRSDRVRTIDFDPQRLVDQDIVDGLVGPLVRDETLVGGQLKIQVLNGTYKTGLASHVSRVIRNMGGEVVRVGNYERQDLTKGFLILDETGSYTAKRLSRAFGVSGSHPPKTSAEKRADITIVLGLEDYERIF